MTEEEWLDGLRGLPDSVILQLHFDLQEKIKKHYKLRDTGKNLDKAIHFCQQQIALAPLAIPALRSAHEERVREYETHLNKPHPNPDFVIPSHHGYRQYATILKKQKKLEELQKLLSKKESEGWA